MGLEILNYFGRQVTTLNKVVKIVILRIRYQTGVSRWGSQRCDSEERALQAEIHTAQTNSQR